jgi:predicted phosphodiesterase
MERQKVTKNIGKLSGKVLVFGGAYSNLQALKKLKEIATDLKIPSSNIMNTGDVVGYCAQPEEVVQMNKDWGVHTIVGNVEIQLREDQLDCGCEFREGSRCDVFSSQWYPYSKSKLSEGSIDWMKTLPDYIEFEYLDLKGKVVHGSYFETADYIFKSTNWIEKEKNFEVTNSDLILAGHSGLPFHQSKNNKHWINSGVIGMPANDGTDRVWFLILDTNEKGEVIYEHHSFTYNHEEASSLMESNKLPKEYALTLKTGIWDNCEILPEEETKLQGVNLEFKSF